MKFAMHFYRVDECGKITHMAGVVPNKKQPDIECTPGDIKWCAIKRAHLKCEIIEMRHALQMFDALKKMWTVPDTPPPYSIDFGNVRQIFNPHGGGTHTCRLAGAARIFVESILELPRFQDWAGNIHLCGIDFIDGNDPTKGKKKPPSEPRTINEILDDDERRECGFTRAVARFHEYVEWVGKYAECGGAAQGVVLAVDKLISALREYGINRIDDICKMYGDVIKSLECLCRALADVETATVKTPSWEQCDEENEGVVVLSQRARSIIMKMWKDFREGKLDRQIGSQVTKRDYKSFFDYCGHFDVCQDSNGVMRTVNEWMPGDNCVETLKSWMHTASQDQYARKKYSKK